VVVHVIESGATAHAPAVLSGQVLVGAGLIAAATVAGAWLASRRSGHREIWLAAAAAVLLVIAGLHLLPDAWGGAVAVKIWPPLVPIVAMGAFTVAGLAARAGCGCCEQAAQTSGAGAAAAFALAFHRFLEGSAVALAASAAVAVALAVHAFAEGLAAGALLGAQRRRVAGWLAAMSVSPIFGAVTASAFPVPQATEPVLLALAAGVIAQAAWVGMRAAFHGLRTEFSPTLATVVIAAIITALAVNAAG
jgi:zinc transporter ZupT